VVVPELVGVAAVVAFVRHARRAPAPFIPIRLLAHSGFGIMNLINFLFGCAALGFGALVPLYAHDRYGISNLSSAMLLIGRAVGMIAVAAAASFALRRTGYRLPMLVGGLIVTASLALMAVRPPAGLTPFWWLAATSILAGIGMGTSVPASNNAILNLADGEVAAVAGLRGMFRQSGGIAAVSISTAILARSTHPGTAFAMVFAAFSVLMLLSLPLVFLVTDQRGRI
jgi:MFS family permease